MGGDVQEKESGPLEKRRIKYSVLSDTKASDKTVKKSQNFNITTEIDDTVVNTRAYSLIFVLKIFVFISANFFHNFLCNFWHF